MHVLVIGSGGREHALAWALAASPLVERLSCAPGNGGIAAIATCVALDPIDSQGIIGFCRREKVEFVVVGPEGPLVGGLVDKLEAAGIAAFGPTAAAAALEGSKGFTKDLCTRHGIPTAAYGRFRDIVQAKRYISERGAPIVVKADGLAAGKGVVVAQSIAEAEAAVDDILGGRFGSAGAEIVIEEFLSGEEASFFALVDGKNALSLASAQDHKTAYDGDRGPNTGGMGAYSPAPIVTETMAASIMDRIIRPTVAAMAAEGRPFKGVLYAGVMIGDDGPKLLEYNTRFGDPECQVLIPRLMSDALPAFMAARDGVLDRFHLRWHDKTALCVVMAAKGYPGDYMRGSVIGGLDDAAAIDDVLVFHASTKRDNGRILANGGRVLGITALGASVAEAQAKAYAAVDRVLWPDGFCRRDIGWRALQRHG